MFDFESIRVLGEKQLENGPLVGLLFELDLTEVFIVNFRQIVASNVLVYSRCRFLPPSLRLFQIMGPMGEKRGQETGSHSQKKSITWKLMV